MKKLYSIIVLACCVVAYAQAQTVSVYSKGVALLLTPDEADEMIFSGTMMSVGNEVIDVTEVDSITYSDQNFDPLRVEVNYNGAKSLVRLPLALADSVEVDKDGDYITLYSYKMGDPEITYALSGTTKDGAFVQDGSYKCKVELGGVNITSLRGAALHIKNGKRIDISVLDGTVNNFVDNADTLHDACFHVKGHPEFEGNGTINITGRGKHAYKSGEYTKLKKSAGTINILAAERDAMHVGQYFKMNGGKITVVEAVKADGIQVEFNNDETKELNGQMFLNGGNIDITLTADSCRGLKADSHVFIGGGVQRVKTTGISSRGLQNDGSVIIYNLNAEPDITLVSTGGYVEIDGKKKRSVGLKTDGSLYFHCGSLTLQADGDSKGRSADIAGDFVYVKDAYKLNASPAINLDGAYRSRTSEESIRDYEKSLGITLPTDND